ncbi:glutamate--tRNA ligase [Candidatus Kaiserbacteria bacterium]|nr:glutamate--tRNA ligase [Candidatus Kaiserbacteria bacterium]
MAKVITRFPPSPTGHLHIGGVRTALFNYLFTAHNGGTMYLRFEDTDRERSKPEFEQDILDALAWLKIPYTLADNPRQSERTAVYQKYIPKLITDGHAYEAEAGKENPDKKVVRFKNPNKKISFQDNVRGEVTFDTTELGDFVIARSIDEPLYHLAVVIDDHEMGVTHVIRGEDHISNTPRQILILEALGFVRPEYAHIPLILAPDRTKLSKRHGAVSVNEYKALGFIPEALLNYLALLGWNPGGEQELFTLDELAKEFTLDRVHKAGAVFAIEKLKWFNREHLKKLSDTEYAKRLGEFAGKAVDGRLVPLLKERAATLQEAAQTIDNEFGFLDEVSYDPELLLQNGKSTAEVASLHLKALTELLENIPDEGFTAAQLKDILWPYADSQGRGPVLWPLRVALSGKERSPDPFTLLALIGKQRSLERIASAAEKL